MKNTPQKQTEKELPPVEINPDVREEFHLETSEGFKVSLSSSVEPVQNLINFGLQVREEIIKTSGGKSKPNYTR